VLRAHLRWSQPILGECPAGRQFQIALEGKGLIAVGEGDGRLDAPRA
jgi:hypothetical protein